VRVTTGGLLPVAVTAPRRVVLPPLVMSLTKPLQPSLQFTSSRLGTSVPASAPP
jgi:hypothetical protein